MISINERRIETLIFPAYGMNSCALLSFNLLASRFVPVLGRTYTALVLQIGKNLISLKKKTEKTVFFCLKRISMDKCG
jgi:hypothetical protein